MTKVEKVKPLTKVKAIDENQNQISKTKEKNTLSPPKKSILS